MQAKYMTRCANNLGYVMGVSKTPTPTLPSKTPTFRKPLPSKTHTFRKPYLSERG